MEQLEILTGRKVDREIAPSPGVSLHFLQDDGVLFDSARQELYGVNTTATFIWCCLCEHFSEEETARRFAETFNVSVSRARTHVVRMIDHWRDLRLIGVHAPTRPATGTGTPPVPTVWTQNSRQGRTSANDDMRDYVLLDMRFRLRISSRALRRQASRLLTPLGTGDTPATVGAFVELAGRDGGYIVRANGKDLEHCDSRRQAPPLLKACLLRMALQYSSDFAAIHAAAATRRGRCIVLPGASGAGKSTVAAGLVAKGFQLVSDDTVVLSNDDLSARPLPFPICLKEGAWKLLAGRFPGLMDLPVHDRPDGKRVRYLDLPRPAPQPTATEPAHVTAIVFLNRGSNREAALVPLSATAALKRLLNGFHPLGGGLDDAKVGRLLRWVSATECFELRFSSLDDGVHQIEQICP